MSARVGRRLATLGVFAISLAILVGASRSQGNVRDEGYYFDAAEEYANWYVDLADNLVHGHPSKSLSRAGIDKGFSYNHEHPALMKTLFGLSWRLFHKCHCPEQAGRHPVAYRVKHRTLNLLDEETAFRLPTMVLTAAMIACVFLFGLELSFGAGLAASGMTLFASRLFFDSQLACFDAPIAAMWVIVVYAYWRGRESKRWSIASGVLLGMALAIKHTTRSSSHPCSSRTGSSSIVKTSQRRVPQARRLPLGNGGLRPLLWMAALSVPVYLACWPWLWYSTISRFNEYASFHLHHVYYNFEYLGTNYNKPPFPWSFVFVMTLVTVPTTTLILAGFGLRQWLRDSKSGAAQGICNGRCGLGTLVVLNAAAPMLVLVLTRAPIFGATKHFHASIPFIALLASYMVARVTTAIPRIAIALPLVVVMPSAIDCARAHPYGLAHYVAFIGGPAGGASARHGTAASGATRRVGFCPGSISTRPGTRASTGTTRTRRRSTCTCVRDTRAPISKTRGSKSPAYKAASSGSCSTRSTSRSTSTGSGIFTGPRSRRSC